MALSVPDFLWDLVLILVFGGLVPIFHIPGRVTPSLDLPFTSNFYLFESPIRLFFDLWADIIGQLLRQSLKVTMNLEYVARPFRRPRGPLHAPAYGGDPAARSGPALDMSHTRRCVAAAREISA